MKKVSNILLILLITVFSNTLGQSVSKEEALVLANNFFSILSEKYSDPQAVSNEYVYLSDKSSEPTLYIFNAHSEGFVIIAADKKVYPVLGYSFNSKLPDDKEQWSPSFEAWIEMYSMQIDAIRIENSEAEKSITEAWHKLETKENPFLRSEKDVSPLLSTTWNQGCGYNALCPVAAGGPCGRAYTGCVATAMAQVMRYMAYPTSGIGSQCYDTANYGELCANFADGIYNYAAMTNNSGNSHVAKLMYHCGISVYMSYSASGSGAFSHNVVRAWKQFFDYKNHILIQKSNYAEVDWIRIIRNEIDKNRPVYYAGFGSGGHAFVFDGYQNLNHFHVNWGWGGSHNGYFYVNNLNPGGYTFTNSQQAIVGTIPGISFTNLDVSSAVTLTCATPASGDISTGVDHINYYKNSYPAAVGKELVYTFSNDLPGRIRIKITNNVGGDVNAFLLHYPHQDSLVTSGKNGLIADDMPASTYYVVVEGDKGKEPTFNIEVICPTIEADLIFLQSNVSPQFIESFLPNVMFSSIVKNIGNTDAASCTIEYYLSVDEFFDGSDILLGSDIFSETSIGQTISFSSSLTMPAGLISGSYYVIFNLDPENSVPESDDDNFSYAYVMVPTDGIMDCTASIILEDGLWHYGNTLSDGASNITMYWSATEMTGPEVIHSFTPSYNGFTKLTFVETHPGTINAMVLPICNENTYLTNVWFANITDTIGFTDFYSVAGTKYYVVVDGYKGVYGDYALKVDLPKECPDVTVEMSKDPNLCDGETFPSFWTNWGASSYQWYKDGAPIQEATKAWFSPTAVGSYFVEITENGCSSASDIINLQMSFPPDAAQIAHNGSLEFCLGGNVELYLSNTVSYPLNWALNGVIIDGATNETFIAEDSGTYSLITTNGSCSVTSENSIIVNAKRLPANINEKLSVPSENIKFQYTFEEDNTDQSGNNYNFVCWSFQPTNDRFGNFWQARYFTSDNVMGYSSNSHALHNEFTHSLWFKTDTDKGGLITGFVNNPWNATIMESMLYMSNSGNLHFYITNSGTPVELISSDSYNDNQWHSVTIQYNGNMKMIINNGMELLENTNSIQKLNITGYWAFAGPNIPSNATDMPTSKYFDGSIDDMICVYESNNLLDSYNYFLPALTVENDGSDEYCLNALISFNILNSEINTEYRIWNQTKEEWYSNPVIGTFGQINITGNDDIIQTTDFKIHANNLLSGCERFLDTVITININPATEIIMQPTGEEICIGNNYTFNIVAIGHSLSYQWKKDGADIGENQPSLTISNADNTDEAFYSCEVTGSCGSVISNEVYLTIADEFIIDEITDATLCEGANASFEVVANGSNKTYQWKKDGVDLSDTDEINGTNTNNLIIENISSADEGNYSCFVTSDCGNGISNEASLTVLELTQISQQPEASYDACENTELTLYIEASGAGINYQWYKNNNPIPEANSSSYHIPNILAEDEGEYYCIVSGICSDEQSITSFLTVYANPIGGQVVNDAEITYGNSTGILNLFGESGAVVGWERKLESMDWEFIENTESFYSEIPINIGTWKYRAIIENGNCNPVYSDEATITVNAREVTISGLIVEDKVYDGTNAATVSNWGTLVDILSEDDVILDFTNAIATFPLTLVGLDYEIVITGIVINGNDAHNYLLNMPLITACITAKPLAITAQSFLKSLGTEFVFDGDEFFVSEMIAGDEVIAVTLTSAGAPIGALEGEYDIVPSDAVGIGLENYDISYINGTLNVVDQIELFISGLVVADKVYDGTNIATVSNWGTLNPVADEDDVELDLSGVVVTFANKQVGNNKVVSITGLALSGANADNYFINNRLSYASITARTLVLSNLTADDKQYDATTVVTGTGFDDNRIAGDILTIVYEAIFADKNAGLDRPVNYFNIAITAGLDMNNYILGSNTAQAFADITQKSISIAGSFTVLDKEYDGTTAATIDENNLSLVGVITDDVVALNAVAVFTSPAVGNDILVNLISSTLNGTDALNYELSFVGAPTTTADITEPPVIYYTLTLVAIPANGGTVSGGGSYEEGENAAVSATTNSEFDFFGWFIGETLLSSEEEYVYTMPAEDVTLTAKFQEKVSVSNPETLTISMYPNPSRGNVIITSDYIIIEISVYDMTGKLVKKVNTEAEQVDLQLSAIEPGLYFVKIITSAGEKMMKLQVL